MPEIEFLSVVSIHGTLIWSEILMNWNNFVDGESQI